MSPDDANAASPAGHIIVADPYPLLRRAFAEMAAKVPPGWTVLEAGDEDGLETLASQHPCDVAAIDLVLWTNSPLKRLRDLCQRLPNLRVLVYGTAPGHGQIRSILRTGARGYVSLRNDPHTLGAALSAVCDGRPAVDADGAEALIEHADCAPAFPHESLSAREFEVFLDLARGRRIRDIAVDLNLSVKTVSTYRNRVLDKLTFENNAQIVRYAIDHRLIDPT